MFLTLVCTIPKCFASYVSPQRVKYVALSVALKIEILCTFQPGGLGPEPPNKGINLFAVCSTYVVVLAQADLASCLASFQVLVIIYFPQVRAALALLAFSTSHVLKKHRSPRKKMFRKNVQESCLMKGDWHEYYGVVLGYIGKHAGVTPALIQSFILK